MLFPTVLSKLIEMMILLLAVTTSATKKHNHSLHCATLLRSTISFGPHNSASEKVKLNNWSQHQDGASFCPTIQALIGYYHYYLILKLGKWRL